MKSVHMSRKITMPRMWFLGGTAQHVLLQLLVLQQYYSTLVLLGSNDLHFVASGEMEGAFLRPWWGVCVRVSTIF